MAGARNLGRPINSPGWDFSPRLSPDRSYLCFGSNRRFTDRLLDCDELLARTRSPGNGLRDIYQVDMAALAIFFACRVSGGPSGLRAE
ncbi:MAG: hypothetical protein ACREK5_00070 [Gemmatimonadota bacterium]